MSKNKKRNKQNTPNRSDRYDWMKDSKGIPVLQEQGSIEFILKPKQKVEIPLAEYRALVENAYAVKVFKRYLETAKYSTDVESFAKALFGEEKPKEDPKKEDVQNDG